MGTSPRSDDERNGQHEVKETCRCGATVDVDAPSAGQAESALTRWREDHRHAERTGICGESPPGAPAGKHCELLAGHEGWHAHGQWLKWSVCEHSWEPLLTGNHLWCSLCGARERGRS